MIAAEARLLTYVEAAERLNIPGTDKARKKFIQRRIAGGKLRVTDLGPRTKRISELHLQQYVNAQCALEKTKRKRR